MPRENAAPPAPAPPQLYDISTDSLRLVTQEDVDALLWICEYHRVGALSAKWEREKARRAGQNAVFPVKDLSL